MESAGRIDPCADPVETAFFLADLFGIPVPRILADWEDDWECIALTLPLSKREQ